jgi:hypothetical protein
MAQVTLQRPSELGRFRLYVRAASDTKAYGEFAYQELGPYGFRTRKQAEVWLKHQAIVQVLDHWIIDTKEK